MNSNILFPPIAIDVGYSTPHAFIPLPNSSFYPVNVRVSDIETGSESEFIDLLNILEHGESPYMFTPIQHEDSDSNYKVIKDEKNRVSNIKTSNRQNRGFLYSIIHYIQQMWE